MREHSQRQRQLAHAGSGGYRAAPGADLSAQQLREIAADRAHHLQQAMQLVQSGRVQELTASQRLLLRCSDANRAQLEAAQSAQQHWSELQNRADAAVWNDELALRGQMGREIFVALREILQASLTAIADAAIAARWQAPIAENELLQAIRGVLGEVVSQFVADPQLQKIAAAHCKYFAFGRSLAGLADAVDAFADTLIGQLHLALDSQKLALLANLTDILPSRLMQKCKAILGDHLQLTDAAVAPDGFAEAAQLAAIAAERDVMASQFGVNFSHVELAFDSTMPSNIHAVTKGQQVTFAPQHFSKEILVEELAHVAQLQAQPSAARPLVGADLSGRILLEQDAQLAVNSVLAGGVATLQYAAPSEMVLYHDTQAPTGLVLVQEQKRSKIEGQLHPLEFFADIANTDLKKHRFNDLNRAYRDLRKAEAKLAAAKHPKAQATAQKQLREAQEFVQQRTAAMKAFIVEYRLNHDSELADMRQQLKHAKKAKRKELQAALAARTTTRRKEIHDEVDAMKHEDPGAETHSVFEPVDTAVNFFTFTFADGEAVELRDHIVGYPTTSTEGVDNVETAAQRKQDRETVADVVGKASLSESRTKILKAISAFEGGFDAVNTYDRAALTWGFVQWTGGSHSDLTETLTTIKSRQPEAFSENFVAYGIDVIRDELTVTLPGSSTVVKGQAAAEAVMKHPKLAAVFVHAGRDRRVQLGEIAAAEKLEIDDGLAIEMHFGKSKVKLVTLLTSEYVVGLLANTMVHSGKGAARALAQHACKTLAAKEAYRADEAWYAKAETAIGAALAAHDQDRANDLAKQLDAKRGSFT